MFVMIFAGVAGIMGSRWYGCDGTKFANNCIEGKRTFLTLLRNVLFSVSSSPG